MYLPVAPFRALPFPASPLLLSPLPVLTNALVRYDLKRGRERDREREGEGEREREEKRERVALYAVHPHVFV